MRRVLLLLPLLACNSSEPAKAPDPPLVPSAAPSAAPSASVPVTDPTGSAAAATSASVAPTASAAPPDTTGAFHGVPVNTKADLVVPVLGKVTYIQFCASWCEPCKKLLPIVQHLYVQYKDKGLVVVAFEQEDTEAAVGPFVHKLGVTFPVFWDDGGARLAEWNVSGMPTSIIVGRAGKVAHVHTGYAPGDEVMLEKRIVAALAAQGG